MAAKKSGISGGNLLKAKLEEIAKASTSARSVKIGFLAGATYPNGTSVAMIAAIQDFGAPSVGIPPRPFFRNMIAAKRPEWPAAMGALLKANNYNAAKTLDQTGFAIAGQLRQSIQQTNAPPLAKSTIRRKGFDKPLIDTGHLFNSVDHEVIS